MSQAKRNCIAASVTDGHRFDADPDPTFHFAILMPIRIRIRILVASVVDGHILDVDPDPTFHLDVDPDPDLDPSSQCCEWASF
jgi:hypothetical protein